MRYQQIGKVILFGDLGAVHGVPAAANREAFYRRIFFCYTEAQDLIEHSHFCVITNTYQPNERKWLNELGWDKHKGNSEKLRVHLIHKDKFLQMRGDEEISREFVRFAEIHEARRMKDEEEGRVHPRFDLRVGDEVIQVGLFWNRYFVAEVGETNIRYTTNKSYLDKSMKSYWLTGGHTVEKPIFERLPLD